MAGGAMQVNDKFMRKECSNLKMDKLPATHFVDLHRSIKRQQWRLQTWRFSWVLFTVQMKIYLHRSTSKYEEPIVRANDGLGFLCQNILSFLLFWLLNNRINNLLSGEEVPHAASVELISKSVEQSVEDGICLCNDWKQLQAETCFFLELNLQDHSSLLQYI